MFYKEAKKSLRTTTSNVYVTEKFLAELSSTRQVNLINFKNALRKNERL